MAYENKLITYQLMPGQGTTGEPVRSSNFSLIINGIGDDLHLHVESCSIPELTVEIGKKNHFNETTPYIQSAELSDIDVVVNDVITPDFYQDFYSWYIQGYDPETGCIGYASEYKRDAVLTQWDSKGEIEIREWQIIGAILTKFGGGDNSMESKGEAMKINASLAATRAFPTFNSGVGNLV